MRQTLQERYKEIAERYGETIVTDEDQKKRDFMYFHPNREFGGKMEDLKLKKVDDGTFIDNGYRWLTTICLTIYHLYIKLDIGRFKTKGFLVRRGLPASLWSGSNLTGLS